MKERMETQKRFAKHNKISATTNIGLAIQNASYLSQKELSKFMKMEDAYEQLITGQPENAIEVMIKNYLVSNLPNTVKEKYWKKQEDAKVQQSALDAQSMIVPNQNQDDQLEVKDIE